MAQCIVDPKRYLARFSFIWLVVLLSTGAFNSIVDPYGLHNAVVIRGFNEIKPEAVTHERLYKAGVIRSRAPTVVALGNSRTERAIAMDHPGWAASVGQRYNAGLVASNIYEARRYLEHANARQRLVQVVIGLDLVAFNWYKPNRADFNDALLDGDTTSRYARLIETGKLLLSADTLISGWYTVRGNCRRCEAPYLDDGRDNPQRLERSLAAGQGHHPAFLGSLKVGLTDLYFPPPQRKFALFGPNGDSPFADLRRILEIARRDHIDLRLFVSPSHAHQWEMLHLAGLWDDFELWKRELVRVLAEDAAAHPGQAAIPLWDFSGYNSVTTEQVPEAGDHTTRMAWYWESSHYTQSAGDLVLDRVFDYNDPARRLPPDFGVRLTEDNINTHLIATRAAGERYRANHAADIAEIAALARQTTAYRRSVEEPQS